MEFVNLAESTPLEDALNEDLALPRPHSDPIIVSATDSAFTAWSVRTNSTLTKDSVTSSAQHTLCACGKEERIWPQPKQSHWHVGHSGPLYFLVFFRNQV